MVEKIEEYLTQSVLEKVITAEVGAIYLTDTLEQCIARVKSSNRQYEAVEKDNGEIWIVVGDYKNLNADYCMIYKNDIVTLVDLCACTIDYFVLTDGTRYSYDEYREKMKDCIKTTKYCERGDEPIAQSIALETCFRKNCDGCRYGASEKYTIEDMELGYRLEYDNVLNDEGFKCLCRIK